MVLIWALVSFQSDKAQSCDASLIILLGLNSLAYFKLLTSLSLQIQLSADKFGSSHAPAGQPICHFYFWNPRLALFKSPTTQLTLTPTLTEPHVLFLCKVYFTLLIFITITKPKFKSRTTSK